MVSVGVEDGGKEGEKARNAKISKGIWDLSRMEVPITLERKQRCQLGEE